MTWAYFIIAVIFWPVLAAAVINELNKDYTTDKVEEILLVMVTGALSLMWPLVIAGAIVYKIAKKIIPLATTYNQNLTQRVKALNQSPKNKL